MLNIFLIISFSPSFLSAVLGSSLNTRGGERPCEPGYYCADDAIKRACPPGYWGGEFALVRLFYYVLRAIHTSDVNWWLQSVKNCSGLCSEGYYCPLGSASAFEVMCGDPGRYCPEGAGKPIDVTVGYYSIGLYGCVCQNWRAVVCKYIIKR